MEWAYCLVFHWGMLVESACLTSLVDLVRAVNDFLSHISSDPCSPGNANPYFRIDAGALLSGAAVTSCAQLACDAEPCAGSSPRVTWCGATSGCQLLEAGEHQVPLREPSLPGHCAFILTEQEQGFAGLEPCNMSMGFRGHFGK